MLQTASREELCQISLTGLRALILLGMLINEPQSLEDIRRVYTTHQVINDDSSDDILRIDLNTLRVMGCKITRADKRTNYKYRLLKHPFSINITDEEINLVRRTYKKIKENADIKTIMMYDDLFKKVAFLVSDEQTKEKLIGISAIKSYKTEFIKELENYCRENRILSVEYKSPASKNSKIIEFAAQKIVFKNDKVYIWGYSLENNEGLSLHIKRILKILSCKSGNSSVEAKSFYLKFLLKNFDISGLENDEKLIKITPDGKYLVEGNYHNEFYATQRILSFGSNCTILEPADFKEKIIKTLKEMREMYND